MDHTFRYYFCSSYWEKIVQISTKQIKVTVSQNVFSYLLFIFRTSTSLAFLLSTYCFDSVLEVCPNLCNCRKLPFNLLQVQIYSPAAQPVLPPQCFFSWVFTIRLFNINYNKYQLFNGNSCSFLYQLSNKSEYFNHKGKMSHLLEIHGDGTP